MGGSRCCVGGCSNVRSDIISLHAFPTNEHLRRKWIKSVQLTGSECSRGGEWKGPPKDSSRCAQLVCSQHFTFDAFTLTTQTNWRLGIKYKARLLESAVPTLFGRDVRIKNCESDGPVCRPVVRKREVQRVNI